MNIQILTKCQMELLNALEFYSQQLHEKSSDSEKRRMINARLQEVHLAIEKLSTVIHNYEYGKY